MLSVQELKGILPKPIIELIENFKGNLYKTPETLFAQVENLFKVADVPIMRFAQGVTNSADRHHRWKIMLGKYELVKVYIGQMKITMSGIDGKNQKRLSDFTGCLG